MTRIKYVSSTERYGKGAVVTLPDEHAHAEINRHVAIAQEAIHSVDSVGPQETRKRIEFVKACPPDKSRPFQKTPHVIGERGFFAESQADIFIASGLAKEFPIVGENTKELQRPPRDKQMRRGDLVTK